MEKPNNIPLSAGVYLYKDSGGRIIYVGKARVLRNRVQSYFRKDITGKTRAMMQKACSIEYIVTNTEKEALLLEASLIKRHRPHYNIVLRDDKQYVLFRIDIKKPYPRLEIVRSAKKDGAKYFGPFTSSHAARHTWKTIHSMFPLRRCSDKAMQNRVRPCLYHHIGLCLAPCTGELDVAKYSEIIQKVILFLAGKSSELIDIITKQMEDASENLEFEQAAKLRDQRKAILQTVEKQGTVIAGGGDMDVIGIAMRGDGLSLGLIFVRGGAVIDRTTFFWANLQWDDAPEVLKGFLSQYYTAEKDIPPRIVLPWLVPTKDLLERGDSKDGLEREESLAIIDNSLDNSAKRENVNRSEAVEEKENQKKRESQEDLEKEIQQEKTKLFAERSCAEKQNYQILNSSDEFNTGQEKSEKTNECDYDIKDKKNIYFHEANDFTHEANKSIHETNDSIHETDEYIDKAGESIHETEIFAKGSSIDEIQSSTDDSITDDFLHEGEQTGDNYTHAVEQMKEEMEGIASVLSEWRGSHVRILVARTKDDHRLIDLAKSNAREAVQKRSDLDMSERLPVLFHSQEAIRRIECVDVSHTSGQDTKVGMVVYQDGKAHKSEYRVWNITDAHGDDYLALSTWAKRRVEHGVPWPHLLLIDGGRGQVNMVQKALEEAFLAEREANIYIDDAPRYEFDEKDRVKLPFILAGIAKARDEHGHADRRAGNMADRIFIPNRSNPLAFREGSAELLFLQSIRDATHDFAIGRHRQARSKRTLDAELLRLPQIGKHTARLLWDNFKDIESMKAASSADFEKIDGIGKKKAQNIVEALKKL